jgi:hypothetical protein
MKSLLVSPFFHQHLLTAQDRAASAELPIRLKPHHCPPQGYARQSLNW